MTVLEAYLNVSRAICGLVSHTLCIPGFPNIVGSPAENPLGLNTNDPTILIQSDPNLLRAGLPRVVGFENLAQLLQRLAGGLNEEEVDDNHLDRNPAAIHDVKPPRYSFYTHGNSICVYDPIRHYESAIKNNHE